MVIDNCNYKILHDKFLDYEDHVYFNYKQKRYDYQVETSFLNNLKSLDNGAIFKALDLSKYDIATELYGYKSTQGDWPCFKDGDYKALNKLIIFLFEEIERKENPNTFYRDLLSEVKDELKITIPKIKISIEPQIKIKLK